MISILILVLILVLVSLSTGVAAFIARSTSRATVCEVISRISMAVALAAFALGVSGRIREYFIGFGTELPPSTLLILNLTTWNMSQAIAIFLIMTMCVIADGLLFEMLHAEPATRRKIQWCSFITTMCLMAFSLFLVAAMFVPLIKPMNDLS